MIIIRNGRAMLGDVTTELCRLEQLFVDLRHIAAGDLPDSRNISSAPVLDDWLITPRLVPALAGYVAGHPKIGDARPTVTSPLEILAPELGWARTSNRLYRLGYRADERPEIAN